MSEIHYGWHFSNGKLRDGRPLPADGEWLVHDGEVIPCKSGLHMSERLIDALYYAPGQTLARCVLRGGVQKHGNDKLVGRERLYLWRVDLSDDLLRSFARACALSVIDMWDAPDVVRRYLETGDESLRAAAWDAARDAAWAAASAAARDAAWDAASAAAWAAAWAAARDAASAAASAAALGRFNADLERRVREYAGKATDPEVTP